MVALIFVYMSYTQLTGSTVLIESPKLTNLAFGGEYLHAVLRIMVSGVTSEPFTPYRRTTFISWSLLALNGATLLMTGAPLINENYLLLSICTMVWLSIAHYVYYVLEDFKRILSIKVFSIVPKIAAKTTTEKLTKKAAEQSEDTTDSTPVKKTKKKVN